MTGTRTTLRKIQVRILWLLRLKGVALQTRMVRSPHLSG
jgi:hypothetical protein